jgi:hypothetical protein
VLPNGHVVVGWGNEPYVTEFDPDGTILFDAKLPRGGQNYRAFRFDWVGNPSVGPTLVAPGGRHGRTAYASWNGATRIAAWRLRAGTAEKLLHPVGATRKRGFETPLDVPDGLRFADVVALDHRGRELGRSRTIRI